MSFGVSACRSIAATSSWSARAWATSDMGVECTPGSAHPVFGTFTARALLLRPGSGGGGDHGPLATRPAAARRPRGGELVRRPHLRDAPLSRDRRRRRDPVHPRLFLLA